MRHLFAASLGFVLLLASPVRAEDERWDARLGAVSGDVSIVSADGA